MPEADAWPPGSGEMATRIRQQDWAATPLGPLEQWPSPLRSAVQMILDHPLPMVLGWGPDLVTLYNDSYRPLLGEKPEALGRPFLAVWEEARDVIAPQIAEALAGRTVRFENARFTLFRGDGPEEAWFDYSYSPLRDEAGAVAGMLNTAIETTARLGAETRLRESEARNAFLLKLSDALRPLADAADVQAATARLVAEHLGADRAMYAEVEGRPGAESGTIRAQYVRPAPEGDAPTVPFPDHFTFGPFGAHTMASRYRGEPLVVPDVDADPAFGAPERAAWAAANVRAAIVATLAKGGRLVAEFGVHSTEPRDWTEAEVSLVREAAERTWAAAERARATDSLRDSEAHLEAELHRAGLLRDLAARLVTEDSLPAIYDEILSAALAITEADAGTVQVYDPADRSLKLLVARGFGTDMTGRFDHIYADSGSACGAALRTGKRAFVDFDDHQDEACRMHVAAGYRSAQATPLLSRDGSPIGMLNTHWRASKHRPSADQLRFLDLLARQAADLIEQRRSESKLRESEERLRRFGEASQDVLWIRDSGTLQWTYLTPAFETVYGLRREKALEGDNYRSWLDLIVPEDREQAERSIGQVLAGEQVAFEYRIRRPSDGAIRSLRNTEFPIADDSGRVVMIGGIGHDVTDLRESEHRSRLLLAELQHRVRSIMAMIRSVARRTGETTETITDYVQHLEGRISAMARTQALLTRDVHAAVDLHGLIFDELRMQAAQPRQFGVTGPDVSLPPRAAEVLGLALHELATNAVKYGALSGKDGRVDVRWALLAGEEAPRLSLIWSEFGVRIEGEPGRLGFGTELVTQRVAYELQGTGTMEFRPTGLVATIEFPLSDLPSILQAGDGARTS